MVYNTIKNILPHFCFEGKYVDGIELTSGKHTVPAKIILRTLTDSWIHGTSYTVEIEVE